MSDNKDVSHPDDDHSIIKTECAKIRKYIAELKLLKDKYINPMLIKYFERVQQSAQILPELIPTFHMRRYTDSEVDLMVKSFFFVTSQIIDSLMRIIHRFSEDDGKPISKKDFKKFVKGLLSNNDYSSAFSRLLKQIKSHLQMLINLRLLRNYLKYHGNLEIYVTTQPEFRIKYSARVKGNEDLINLLKYETKKPENFIYFQLFLPKVLDDIIAVMEDFLRNVESYLSKYYHFKSPICEKGV